MHYEKFQDGTVKCIEDEIPFEVPEGWAWERLGNVSTIARGGSPRPIEDYLTDNVDGINWIKIGDTEKDGKYILHTKEKIKPAGLSKTRYVQSGDFLLTNSMSFGRPYILKTNGCIHDGWLVIGNIDTVFNQDYLYYTLSSGFMYTTLSLLAAGSTVKNLKSETVRSVLFPIPPFGEQERMARRLEQLIILVDAINAEKGQLVDIINQTKSKILDLAIRGKLVPQDPNDEPASVLLERIRSEKEELIKQGKIKRDKKESVIFKGDDNSYYEKIGDNVNRYVNIELPQGWSIGSFSQLNMFQSLNIDPRTHPDKLFELYSVPNWEIGKPEILAGKEIGSSKQSICENDVLVCKINPRINRVWVCEHTTPHYLLGSSEWIVFRNSFLDSRYVELYFSSPYFRKLLLSNVSGVGGSLMRAQPESVKKYPILIPPYQEQLRIVKQVSHMLEQLNAIKQSVH